MLDERGGKGGADMWGKGSAVVFLFNVPLRGGWVGEGAGNRKG